MNTQKNFSVNKKRAWARADWGKFLCLSLVCVCVCLFVQMVLALFALHHLARLYLVQWKLIAIKVCTNRTEPNSSRTRHSLLTLHFPVHSSPQRVSTIFHVKILFFFCSSSVFPSHFSNTKWTQHQRICKEPFRLFAEALNKTKQQKSEKLSLHKLHKILVNPSSSQSQKQHQNSNPFHSQKNNKFFLYPPYIFNRKWLLLPLFVCVCVCVIPLKSVKISSYFSTLSTPSRPYQPFG